MHKKFNLECLLNFLCISKFKPKIFKLNCNLAFNEPVPAQFQLSTKVIQFELWDENRPTRFILIQGFTRSSKESEPRSDFLYFWRITSPSSDGKPSYLLGSVNVPHLKVLPALPDNVKEALEVLTKISSAICCKATFEVELFYRLATESDGWKWTFSAHLSEDAVIKSTSSIQTRGVPSASFLVSAMDAI